MGIIGDNVRRVREARGLSQAALARRAGVSQPTIADLESGHNETTKKLPSIASALGVSPAELDPQLAQTPAKIGDKAVGDAIEEIQARAGAGPGGLTSPTMDHNGIVISQEAVRDYWLLPERVMRETIRARPADIKIFEVVGDSMEPRLSEGDRVFVNTQDTFPHPEGIFALFDGDGIVIKRVQIVRGADPQRVKIYSVNPQYDAYEALMDEIRIIGRFAGRFTIM